jgi:ureidoacrylate peracid hydrolase
MQTKTLADLVKAPKAAVIVVDVQNDFCEAEGSLGKTGAPTAAAKAMIPTLRSLLDAARDSGAPVIFIQTIHEDATDSDAWRTRSGGAIASCCRKDTWGAEFTDVAPRENEPVVIKHRYSAFVNTRLDSVLRTLKIETLIMTGVSTNVCVESTARLGYMLDYNIVFVSDCTAAYSQEEHDGALYNVAMHFGKVVAATDVIGAWETALTLAPA